MEHPFRFVRRPSLRVFAATAMGALLVGCAYAPRPAGLAGLEPERSEFNHGRVTVVLTDEYGSPMPGYRVDFTWQKPDFYKTSALTNRDGQVTFTGVPDVAEVSINHDAGLFESTLAVPQRGSSELRVMVDTLGAFEQRRQAERAAMLGLRPQR